MNLLTRLRCLLGKHDGQWYEIGQARDGTFVLTTKCWRCGTTESVRPISSRCTHPEMVVDGVAIPCPCPRGPRIAGQTPTGAKP